MNVRLTLATAKDLPQVLSYVHAYHEFEGVKLLDDDASAIQSLLGESPLGRLWLIHAGAKPIGYVAICFGYSIEFGGRDAFIDEMFIVPEHRSKGFGTAALQLVKTEAAVLGIKALHLEVARSNDRTRRLYASVGFEARERFVLMSALTNGEAAHQGVGRKPTDILQTPDK